MSEKKEAGEKTDSNEPDQTSEGDVTDIVTDISETVGSVQVESDDPGSSANAQLTDDGEIDPETLSQRLAEAGEQIATLKDQALRGQAEAENVRRRAARDVESAHKYALEKFAGDLLPVLDSLEKAIESAEQTSAENGAGAIVEGMELSLKLFLGVLEKAGIRQIDPVGEPFDPQLHEAMAAVEHPDSEPNSVIEVMQKGYSLNGRLVRAAMVVVSKVAS